MIANFYRENELDLGSHNTELLIGSHLILTPEELLLFLDNLSSQVLETLRSSSQELILLEKASNKHLYEIFGAHKKLHRQKILIYYGWREKERLTGSFFISQEEHPDKLVLVNYKNMVESITKHLLETNDDLKGKLKGQMKVVKFYKELLKKCYKANPGILTEFNEFLQDQPIFNFGRVGSTSVLINFLLLGEKFASSRLIIYRKILASFQEAQLSLSLSPNDALLAKLYLQIKMFLASIRSLFYSEQKKYADPLIRFMD